MKAKPSAKLQPVEGGPLTQAEALAQKRKEWEESRRVIEKLRADYTKRMAVERKWK